MKLAISNIAWENTEFDEHLALVRELGCQGLELAPNAVWPEPVDVSREDVAGFKNKLDGFGLQVAGFHALLFTRPDLHLFKDRTGLRDASDYLKKLTRLCGDMRGKALVFGSPRNRALQGRTYDECMDWAVECFRDVADEAERCGVLFCIEPLPPREAEFIRSSDEGVELVRRVDRASFGLHLDAKAMIESNEDPVETIDKYGGLTKHFHVGDPGLTPPGSTGVDHSRIGRALKRAGYGGFVSIEMRRGFGPTRKVVTDAVRYVQECYINA